MQMPLKKSKREVKVRRLPTKRTLDRLGEGATASFGAVTKLIEDRAVAVPDSASDKRGWGQYLDEDHKSPRQWGRYGTSAAVRALACAQRATNPDDPLANRASIQRLHPELLPDGVPAENPTLKTHDYDRVIKVSYIIEGVQPQEARIPVGSEPEIVQHLIDLRHPGQKGWSSRDGGDSYRDRRLSTAVALHALRRFPGAQKDEHVREAYDLLAGEVKKESVQIDLSALAGIALVEAGQPIRDLPKVQEALATLDKRLSAWAKRQKRVALDRPYFNGFVEHDPATGRDSTDYVFLSPELLAARYFLKRDLPKTRRFVLCVVAALINNIKRNTTNEMGGYKIQETMIRTVDQAWALDLLETFEGVRKEKPRDLLPRKTGWLTGFGVLISVWFVLVVGMAIGLVATGQPIFPVIGILIGVLFTLAMRARE
jgi:hypothetical protein